MAARLDGQAQGMGVVIGLSEEAVTRLCVAETDVFLANINCPGQYTIAGSGEGVSRVLAAAQESGAYKTKRLPYARAIHTSLLDGLSAEVGEMLARVPLGPPLVPVISVWDGARITRIDELRHFLTHLLSRPVRWESAMRGLLTAPNPDFIEVGPASMLSGMMPYLGHAACARTATEVLKCGNREDSRAEGEP